MPGDGRSAGVGAGADALVRHALVWIRADRRADARAAEPSREPDVARWFALGRPAVVRRRDGALGPHEVALGIALPSAEGRARIALSAPASAIARIAPPLLLADALPAAPPEWGALSELLADARRAGVALRVYGSLAWQRLTGERYLLPGSDADLVVPGAAPDDRARALALLRRWERHDRPRLDGELDLGRGRAVAWREVLSGATRVLVKSTGSASLEPWTPRPGEAVDAAAIAALREELATDPKPGLVSPSARGAHGDMDARTFGASVHALRGCFGRAAEAGAAGAPFEALRAAGIDAEARMLRATGGVNTHRGAILCLGLLSAAAGWLAARRRRWDAAALGAAVRRRWGDDLRRLAPDEGSHGEAARRRHGVPGAREEAALGFPHVLEVGLPALEESLRRGAPRNAARVQALFAILARLPDTNLLHRGGWEGLSFARGAAAGFLRAGGVHRDGWEARAREVGGALVARNLSPGGSADLLAATLLVHALQASRSAPPRWPSPPGLGRDRRAAARAQGERVRGSP